MTQNVAQTEPENAANIVRAAGIKTERIDGQPYYRRILRMVLSAQVDLEAGQQLRFQGLTFDVTKAVWEPMACVTTVVAHRFEIPRGRAVMVTVYEDFHRDDCDDCWKPSARFHGNVALVNDSTTEVIRLDQLGMWGRARFYFVDRDLGIFHTGRHVIKARGKWWAVRSIVDSDILDRMPYVLADEITAPW